MKLKLKLLECAEFNSTCSKNRLAGWIREETLCRRGGEVRGNGEGQRIEEEGGAGSGGQ